MQQYTIIEAPFDQFSTPEDYDLLQEELANIHANGYKFVKLYPGPGMLQYRFKKVIS